MKERASFQARFWQLPIFRGLRPRIMTMILALVMPLCIVCIALSVISAVHGSRQVYTIGQNGLSAFMEQTVLRCRYEGIDLLDGFPSAAAEHMQVFIQSIAAMEGSVYVSSDGVRAYRILPDGQAAAEPELVESLLKARSLYLWQGEDPPLDVLVTFGYSFTFRYLPSWFWIAIAVSAVTLLICPFLYRRLREDILDPMEIMNTASGAFASDNSYRIPPQTERIADDFLALYDGFNRMAEEVQRSHEKDLKLLESEMDNLRLQVNPHMLLNSYNMIYALAQTKNYEVIQDYTLCLTDYFRYVLRRGQQTVALKQELEFVDNFIRIQRIRFPGRFSYVYQAEEDCMEAQIPPLLVENFVENSIKYALEPSTAIEIMVSARREQEGGRDTLHIAISDTGSGIRPEVLEKLQAREPYIDEAGRRHIGVWNCMRRVELFYGEKGEIHISSAPGRGTQVYLIVPFALMEKEEHA